MRDKLKLYPNCSNPFMRTILCFVLVSFCIASAQQPCDPGFDCWLRSQVITINDYSLTQNETTLTVDQITCKDISLGNLNSNLTSPYSIHITTSSSELNCIGYWTYTTSTNDTSKGTITSKATGISVIVDINAMPNATYELVGGVDVACSMQVSSVSNSFGNNNIPSSFQNDVQQYFNEQVGYAGCSFVVQSSSNGLMYTYDGISNWATNAIDNSMMLPDPFSMPIARTVNFTNNPYVGLINYVVNDVLSPNGSLPINTIVNVLTNNTGAFSFNWGNSSAIQYFSPLASQTYNFSFAHLTITPQWLNVTGLNDWAYLNFAQVMDSNTLDSETVLNNLGLNVEFLINISFVDPSAQGGSFIHKAVLKTSLDQSTLMTGAALGVSTDILSFLSTSQLLQPGCLAQSIIFVWINYLNVSFSMEQTEIAGMPGQFTSPLQGLIEQFLASFLQSLVPSADQFVNAALTPAIGVGLNEFNFDWQNVINSAQTLVGTCPVPHHDGAAFNKVATLYAGVAAVGIFLLVVLVSYLIVRLREGEETPLLFNHKTIALMHNPGLPAVLRYGVVLLLLANAAMFIASNASLGASVYLVVKTADSSTMFPSLFNFSLINSVKDMWNAKVYALSILIALFSGVWPYTKLVLLLFCWCSPTSILNLQRRGRILIMLDAMGKWSLIDSFVLILMMVAFHFSLAPPVSPTTPAGSLIFEAYVEPHFGFYSFLIATMLSLVLTHLAIKLHDITMENLEQENKIDNTKEALWAHAAGSSTPYRAAYILTIVTVLLVTSSVLLVFGINSQSFDFSFRGAFGVLLKFLNESDNLSFSVISLGHAFPGSSLSPDSAGTRFIQVSFFIFAIAMPVLYLACLLVLWMVPLTYRFQSRLLTLTATIHAWSALEVFVISIIAALLELQQFAQFIVGNRCDMINKILATYANDLLHGDDKCFDVVATLRTGCWVLFSACVIYVVVGSLVVKGCHTALKTRLNHPVNYVN